MYTKYSQSTLTHILMGTLIAQQWVIFRLSNIQELCENHGGLLCVNFTSKSIEYFGPNHDY